MRGNKMWQIFNQQVRVGKISKDFEKWGDESKCVDFTKCFVIFYGSEFKLRSLSVVGKIEIGLDHHCNRCRRIFIFRFVYWFWQISPKLFFIAFSEQECENWIRGLRYMVNDTLSSPYPLEMERWLRKEFYHIENSRETYVAHTFELSNLKRIILIMKFFPFPSGFIGSQSKS